MQRRQNMRGRRDLQGALILEYGRQYRRFLVGIALAWIGLLALLTQVAPSPEAADLPILALALLVVTVPLGYGTIETLGVSHRVTEDGLERRSPWTSPLFVRWSEVETIQYRRILECYAIHCPRGVVRVSIHLDGLAEFQETARLRVPRDRRPGLP